MIYRGIGRSVAGFILQEIQNGKVRHCRLRVSMNNELDNNALDATKREFQENPSQPVRRISTGSYEKATEWTPTRQDHVKRQD